eukprot:3291677-Rhodomonas_salina.2
MIRRGLQVPIGSIAGISVLSRLPEFLDMPTGNSEAGTTVVVPTVRGFPFSVGAFLDLVLLVLVVLIGISKAPSYPDISDNRPQGFTVPGQEFVLQKWGWYPGTRTRS